MRTKTKAIGLNRKELEGLALKIDKNLQLEEDASDEEVDVAIEEAIDAALPFLEVSQSVAQRSIQSALQRRRSQDEDDADDDDADDDNNEEDGNGDRNASRQGKGGKNNRKKNNDSEDSEIMKFLREQSDTIKALKTQIEDMQGDRVKESRKTK